MKIKNYADLIREHPEIAMSAIALPTSEIIFWAYKLGHFDGEIAQLNAQLVKREIERFNELAAIAERGGNA